MSLRTMGRTSMFLLALAAAPLTANAQVLFQSGLSSGTDFTVVGATDYRATFGVDYAALAIPQAPNGTDRVGLKLEANLSTGVTAHDVAVFPTNFSPAANQDYRVSVDVWMNWAVGSGFSTEFGGLFVGHNGSNIGRNGMGLLYTGDGGAARDYRAYKNTSEQFLASGQYNAALTAVCDPTIFPTEDCRNNQSDFFTTQLPEFDVGLALDPDDGQGVGQVGTQAAGIAGFQWVTMQIDVFPNRLGAGVTQDVGVAEVTMIMHGNPEAPNVPPLALPIVTLDNSNGGGNLTNLLAKPAMVYADIFTSIADFPEFNYGIFDNFKVERLASAVDGDFNDDGLFNCADVNGLTADIAAGTNTASFDLTGDGNVNIADLDAWRLAAGEVNIGPGRAYRVGDANLDGVVDGSDFNIWNANKFTGNTAWCSGNFNADTVTDGSDFNLWNSNKFTASDGSLVPEPASFGLLACGLAILVARRGR